ncbi:MAG TPA: hypothetical protein VMW58_05705 [Anaerolineae bacterium]|nr:hypothetical protein [Anaerolineae bacterium]
MDARHYNGAAQYKRLEEYAISGLMNSALRLGRLLGKQQATQERGE